MRITQIRLRPWPSLRFWRWQAWPDLGWFVLDQLGHGAIALAPVAHFARGWSDVAIAAVVILTVREVEQARDTVEEWLEVRKNRRLYAYQRTTVACLLSDLHLPDRFADVSLGALVSVGAFELGRYLLGLLGWLT